MRRAVIAILGILGAASLLLALGTATLWVRSYWATDYLRWTTWSHLDAQPRAVSWHLTSRGQVLAFNSYTSTFADAAKAKPYYQYCRSPGLHWQARGPEPNASWSSQAGGGERYGFAWHGRPLNPRNRSWGFTLPAWFGTAGFGLPPVLGFVLVRGGARRGYRLRRGLCVRCGYDLRASPERCPECGAPVPAGKEQGGVARVCAAGHSSPPPNAPPFS